MSGLFVAAATGNAHTNDKKKRDGLAIKSNRQQVHVVCSDDHMMTTTIITNAKADVDWLDV